MIKQGAMSKVENVTVDHFRVPLAIPLSDSTHGEITQFGLVT
ncbi:MAG: uroporphyrinogen decarboxylase, partial [Gammaproteobacteria bacterium]